MMDVKRLSVLVRLAAAKKEADLIALTRAGEERAAIETRLSNLDAVAQAARDAAISARDAVTPATGAAFARYVTHERARLDTAMSHAAEIWHARREAAAQSFGSCEALRQLHEELVRRNTAARVRRHRDGV